MSPLIHHVVTRIGHGPDGRFEDVHRCSGAVSRSLVAGRPGTLPLTFFKHTIVVVVNTTKIGHVFPAAIWSTTGTGQIRIHIRWIARFKRVLIWVVVRIVDYVPIHPKQQFPDLQRHKGVPVIDEGGGAHEHDGVGLRGTEISVESFQIPRVRIKNDPRGLASHAPRRQWRHLIVRRVDSAYERVVRRIDVVRTREALLQEHTRPAGAIEDTRRIIGVIRITADDRCVLTHDLWNEHTSRLLKHLLNNFVSVFKNVGTEDVLLDAAGSRRKAAKVDTRFNQLLKILHRQKVFRGHLFGRKVA